MVAAEKALNGELITLDNFIPNSGSEFLEYAELIFHKLRPFQKNYHYIDLVKDVMRLSLSSLKAADVKSIQSSITAILNAKIKAERSAGKKKKGGAKKTQLLVDKPEDDKRINMHEVLDD
ncbi:hypothetical protein SAY86_021132 [Trapa natans]|uniref:Eukaryotic translation initiation factor 3 30 kDa subunit n=1 Tax=Trapa natans TaxID=22666 RepID=A0AAN7RFF2_TRANT|nr:hypothetical protein SAY86_021132 [Trapa natans]